MLSEQERLLQVGKAYYANLQRAATSNLQLKQFAAARAQLRELSELAPSLRVHDTIMLEQQLAMPEIALVGLARKATMDGETSLWLFDDDSDADTLPPPPLEGVQTDKRSVCPLVETPPEVLDAALALAGVTPSDFLCDLGCGNGRMLVRAATRIGCACVGFEVNPFCLRRSRESAERARVSHLVEVVEFDLLAADEDAHFRAATVVFLYLQPRVVQRLERLLTDAVDSGKRVVIYCPTGASARPGNALGELTPAKESMAGMLKLYAVR